MAWWAWLLIGLGSGAGIIALAGLFWLVNVLAGLFRW